MIKLLPNGILIGPNVLFWLSYPLFDSNYLVTEPGYAEVTPIHLTRLVPNYYVFLGKSGLFPAIIIYTEA